jgi:hypothetical protein
MSHLLQKNNNPHLVRRQGFDVFVEKFFLIQFQIAIEHFMPRQSLLVQFLHEWVWVELLDIPYARFAPQPFEEHLRSDAGWYSSGVAHTLHAGLLVCLLVAAVVVYIIGERLSVFADSADTASDAGLSLVVLS